MGLSPEQKRLIRARTERALRRIKSGTPIKTACRLERCGVETLYRHHGPEVTRARQAIARAKHTFDGPTRAMAIKELNELLGWNKSQIAAAFGMSRQAINEYLVTPVDYFRDDDDEQKGENDV